VLPVETTVVQVLDMSERTVRGWSSDTWEKALDAVTKDGYRAVRVGLG
jgi:hypothetical protein